MKAIEPIPYIRQNWHYFFKSLPVTGVELAQRMVGDVFLCGSHSCYLFCNEGFWIVTADHNWFGPHPEHDVFNRILAFKEAGDNSVRSEVLINAFASFVWTSSASGENLIKGEQDDAGLVVKSLEALTLPFKWERVLAFKMAD